jgi:hypothetical protein
MIAPAGYKLNEHGSYLGPGFGVSGSGCRFPELLASCTGIVAARGPYLKEPTLL